MTNIFHTAKVTLADELHRFRNRHFLEAAMAASALLALADEEVLISERLALDYVLENVGELKIFDVHKAVDMFRDHVEAIQRDNVAGRERVSKALARFSGDEHAAHVLINACVFIAKADGDFSEQEKQVVTELCRVLRMDASKIRF